MDEYPRQCKTANWCLLQGQIRQNICFLLTEYLFLFSPDIKSAEHPFEVQPGPESKIMK